MDTYMSGTMEAVYICMHAWMHVCQSSGALFVAWPSALDSLGLVQNCICAILSHQMFLCIQSPPCTVTLMEPLDIQIRLTRGSVHHLQAIFPEGRLVRGSKCMSIQYVYADPCFACCVPHPHTSCEISDTCLVEKHPTDRAYSPGAELRICHLDNGWNLKNTSEISYDVP